MDIGFAKPHFSIGHQNCSNPGTSRDRRNIKLIQLGTLQKVKADRRSCLLRYAHMDRSGSKSLLKGLQRTHPGEFRRYNSSMGVLPAVEPEPGQLSDLRDFRVSDVCASHVIQKCRTIESRRAFDSLCQARARMPEQPGQTTKAPARPAGPKRGRWTGAARSPCHLDRIQDEPNLEVLRMCPYRRA
jgi:hypothetical protein